MEEKKTCNKCKIEKSIRAFSKSITCKGGINTICRACCRKYLRDRYHGRIPEKDLKNKRCPSCGETKPVSEYYPSKQGARKCTAFCKVCCREKRKEFQQDPKNRAHSVWVSMLRRCDDPTDKNYKYYGGKGVGVCEKWANDFEAFFEFLQRKGWGPELQMHRLDHDHWYTEDNIVFLSAKRHGRLGPNAKLDKNQVSRIKALMNEGQTNAELAERFRLTIRAMQYIRSGRSWPDVCPKLK